MNIVNIINILHLFLLHDIINKRKIFLKKKKKVTCGWNNVSSHVYLRKNIKELRFLSLPDV